MSPRCAFTKALHRNEDNQYPHPGSKIFSGAARNDGERGVYCSSENALNLFQNVFCEEILSFFFFSSGKIFEQEKAKRPPIIAV